MEPVWTIYLLWRMSEISTVWYTGSTHIRDNRRDYERTLGVIWTTRTMQYLLGLFVGTFFAIRVIGWTVVILQNWAVIMNQAPEVKWMFFFLSALQYYWGLKIVSMVKRETTIS